MDPTFARPSPRIDRAAEVARLVHRGAVRKGTARPYILHPVAVARILEEHGYGEDLVVAGLLHDTVEDAKYDHEGFQRDMCTLAGEGRMPCPAGLVEFRTAFLRFIDDEFGRNVLDLVLGVSETKNHGGPALDWLERKQEQLVHLAGASEHQAALKAADALHNIESTLADLRELGLTVLDRFRGGALTVWHYSAIAHLVVRRMPDGHPLAARVHAAAEQLSLTVRALRPARPGDVEFPPPAVY
jgi:(p)ppGpp synthase/HD superfamily hydrolase